MTDTKWSVLSSETVVKDRWIDLRAETCVTPSGQEIAPYYVLSYPDWVNIVAITTDDEIVLVRQYRHGAADIFTEIPGGAVDAGDPDPVAAAKRELLEETGYEADNWELVSSLYANPASHTNRLHVYLARNAIRTAGQMLEHGEEGLSVSTMPVDTLLKELRSGLIGQALHVSSIMLALQAAGRLG
jgi:8-oxo-dGTP pyrophosphatase MutT (NUDIX family)